MSIGDRLRYTPYLAVVASAVILLVTSVASADVIALLPSDAFNQLFGPTFVVVVLLAAFAAAPAAARYLPMPGDEEASRQGAKPAFGYGVRTSAIVFGGLFLALLLALALRFLAGGD